MNVNILEMVDSLRNDFESGGTEIISAALKIFCNAAQNFDKTQSDSYLYEISKLIISSKPAMPGIRNILEISKNLLLTKTKKSCELYDYISMLIAESGKRTVEKAAERIISEKKKYSVFSCSYSNNVVKTLARASEGGAIIKLNAAESLWRGVLYGKALSKKCSKFGISYRIFPDNEIRNAIAESDIMLTGADAFLPDKSIINGIPTLSAAKECFGKIPYLVVAESFKKTNLAIQEDGFDIIPGSLVKEIFSDNIF
jgi:translation initiation factor 2B subunit (eIF-2B alpha/beta/delta family)